MGGNMLAPKTQVIVDDMNVMLLFDLNLLSPWLLTTWMMGGPEKAIMEFVGRQVRSLGRLDFVHSCDIRS